MTESDPGFAPQDLSDGRPIRDYKTRYPDKVARRGITIEGIYLGVLLVAVPIAAILIYLHHVGLNLPASRYRTLSHYSYAWLGGLLGGTLFSLKWLYHTVAHGTWNQDRRLWRIFTPFLSGGLAFGVILLVDGRILIIIDSNVLGHSPATMGVSFLIGYFSDGVVARLAETAGHLFGEGKVSLQQRGPDGDRG